MKILALWLSLTWFDTQRPCEQPTTPDEPLKCYPP